MTEESAKLSMKRQHKTCDVKDTRVEKHRALTGA